MFIDSAIIVASWAQSVPVRKNWGDKLNPVLINRLSGKPVVHEKAVLGWEDRPVFKVVGSGLGGVRENDIIWGMGFISSTAIPSQVPLSVTAVRGPKSRQRLLENNVSCPEVYGDPAILYPLTYTPKVDVRYEYGIIHHFRENDAIPPAKIKNEKSVLYIDVLGDINTFVDQILSCRVVVSSSLHGLICAHSYGVNALWMKASDLPLGDDFKFFDYFSSIGYPDVDPVKIDDQGFLMLGGHDASRFMPRIDGDLLIEHCPFLSKTKKRDWQRKRQRLASAGQRGTIFNADMPDTPARSGKIRMWLKGK
ncbi:MAG: polysaccharide pyruvyl transferase family protein [Mesorhizobium sp.]|nr:polysaccharide pyruvyl transferase family protein [Mesorhizobium sp.]MBL8578920.1 polysaccharide pyruvyl transferase family protein [Mesorhizobium sp.]